MFERLRWLTILLPALVVGAIELLSDSVLDELLPFPLDTVLVASAVLGLSFAFSTFALGRIRRLTAALEIRNAELERRNTSARALHRVSVAITALDDLDEVLQAIVGQARQLLGADVAVLLMAGGDGEFAFRAGSGPAEAIDPAGGLAGDEALRFVTPAFARARLGAPLRRGDRTMGLLFVGSWTERSFDVDDIETLSSLANQAAIGLENARLHARLRELAVVAERERIAREMHDGLAQVLGYVNTKSQAAETLLEGGRTDEARVQLGELAAAARSVYVDVREAILGLRSPISPEVGLVGALEEYAGRFAEASKLAVLVTASDEARALDLPDDVQAQVFRIVQESLTNVRKHAAAGRAEVVVATEGTSLVITLVDDGRGFEVASDPDGRGDWPHYGLAAMRERGAAIGASVEWSRGAAGGTSVRLVVPVERTGGAAGLLVDPA